MKNHLANETSPYLLQHSENPVNWYSWCNEAFEKAKREDKPVFLSIGYSTCHWCHVMAHESFEDAEVAEALNRDFVCVKVDREERPDIDSVYMNVCQAFTGSGGWPLSVFLTPEQKPFYAGTYFPKTSFLKFLKEIVNLWRTNRGELERSAGEVVQLLNRENSGANLDSWQEQELAESAFEEFRDAFDQRNGGFGRAPKFPSPHNLLFLLDYYETTKERFALEMVEKTLLQMYRGGIFDHIGFGFSRYSTDPFYLVPHFEKMLYDNALLILAYCKTYQVTKNEIYKTVAEKTADYVLRELTDPDGGFYSAQDADSDGVEGKFYVFEPEEILAVLGEEEGRRFNACYGITKEGNFEGKNIPNLLHGEIQGDSMENSRQKLRDYRNSRTSLHLDDKILTAWNGLMITALATLFDITQDETYLHAAKRACAFLEKHLSDGSMLFTSYRDGKSSEYGFLDDYAFSILAHLSLYAVTLDRAYLDRALVLCKAAEKFRDVANVGYFLSAGERLVLKPKETYDGAMPSGNSAMAYALVWLSQIIEDPDLEELAKEQLAFMSSHARQLPSSSCGTLLALSRNLNPPVHIVCALENGHETFPKGANVVIIPDGNADYPVVNGETTYYVCDNQKCLPPRNYLGIQ